MSLLPSQSQSQIKKLDGFHNIPKVFKTTNIRSQTQTYKN